MAEIDQRLTLSPLELVRNVHFGLVGPANRATGWIHVLTDEDFFGFASDKQKEALLALKKEIEAISNIDQEILEWFHHRESMREE